MDDNFINHTEKLKQDYELLISKRKDINWDKYLKIFPKGMRLFPNGMPRRQFVGWKFVLNKEGKVSKIPVDLNHSTKGNIKLAKANEEYLCCYEKLLDENNNQIIKDGKLQFDRSKYHPTWIKNAYSWSTLDYAIKKAKELGEIDGIGFEAGCGICTIDIDSCIDKNGNYSPIAKEIMDNFNTVSFKSPSGTGLHLYFYFKPTLLTSKLKTKTPQVEAYISKLDRNGNYIPPAHFFAEVGTPARKDNWKLLKAEESTKLFETLMTKYLMPTLEELKQKEEYDKLLNQPLDLFDKENSLGLKSEEIINKLRLSYEKNKDKYNGLNKFSEMYDFGNWYPFLPEIAKQGLGQSDADLLFCKMIAFYTDSLNQVDLIFRSSKMMREKWDKIINYQGITYGQRTILIALSQMKDKKYNKNKKNYIMSYYVHNHHYNKIED